VSHGSVDEPDVVARQVEIAPPLWFVRVAQVAAGLVALLGVSGGVGAIGQGQVSSGLFSIAGGLALAVMSWDVSQRHVIARGDVLDVRQWFRTVEILRDDIVEFAATRASLIRWDIVVRREDGPQLRLWATRMLVAGRIRRVGWLDELEAWRTST